MRLALRGGKHISQACTGHQPDVQSLLYHAATVTTSISSLLPPEARAAVFPYLDVIDVMGEAKARRAYANAQRSGVERQAGTAGSGSPIRGIKAQQASTFPGFGDGRHVLTQSLDCCPCFSGMAGLGLSLVQIHIYLDPLKKALQVLWAVGVLGSLFLMATQVSTDMVQSGC